MATPITVLKFGSSVLSARSRLAAVVHDIYRSYRRGHRVVVVVSAIGRHTDMLLDEAGKWAEPAEPETALAKLLSAGEEQAAALLTIVAHRAGIPCELLDAADVHLRLLADRLDADPCSVNRHRILTALDQTPVVILPGFAGRHVDGGTGLLGRGGSDLTAVFLAEALGAQSCRLVKDVDGIYERDPADAVGDDSADCPSRYRQITYDQAQRVAGVLVQPKAVEYLQCTRRRAAVTALLRETGTEVGASCSVLAEPREPVLVRTLMLGLGTVGQAVFTHLRDLPEHFKVIGIGVRDPLKRRQIAGAPVSGDVSRLLDMKYDVLVDVCGDTEAARTAIARCLSTGKAAVTANKQLVAKYGIELAEIAAGNDTRFLYSAAVGGGVPMIEALEQATASGPVRSLRGVLNGTSNFILDRLEQGSLFDAAVREAQARGIAEADVARDVSGRDAADKLRILARHAFGRESEACAIARQGIEGVTREQVGAARSHRRRIRLVASFDASGTATVRPEHLDVDDFLYGAEHSENRLVITAAGGTEFRVQGIGAGAWPSAEAVLADVIDLHPAIARHRSATHDG